jgi:RecB family exonuclease
LIFKQRKLQSVSDTQAPPLKAATVRGGTRVLADQSACPFRAFAHHRLRAEELETPAEGLDPSDRGKLLHALMASLFAQVKSSADLALDLDFAIELAAAFAVKELKLEGRFAELERTRLARLAREWLEVERGRKDFEVVAVEKPIAFKVAGLELSGRIDRIDRIAGGLAIIDYKTSRNPSPNQWKPPRPEDPQLPIYAVASQEPVAAVAFAKVRPGEMRYMGFSREKDSLPRVRKAEAWQPLLQSWSEEAEALGTAFAAGAARVDPKNELQTCRYCDLQTLCRVYEKVNPLKEDEAEGFGE